MAQVFIPRKYDRSSYRHIISENVGLALYPLACKRLPIDGFLLFWLMKPRQKITLQRHNPGNIFLFINPKFPKKFSL